MSKVFEAEYDFGEGVIRVLGNGDDKQIPAETVEIISEGDASSSGILLIDGEKLYYVARTTPDVVSILDKVVDALDAIEASLSALDSAGFLISATAGVPSPPLADGGISTLNSAKNDLEELKENLR